MHSKVLVRLSFALAPAALAAVDLAAKAAVPTFAVALLVAVFVLGLLPSRLVAAAAGVVAGGQVRAP